MANFEELGVLISISEQPANGGKGKAVKVANIQLYTPAGTRDAASRDNRYTQGIFIPLEDVYVPVS